jgi:hypothetical protein
MLDPAIVRFKPIHAATDVNGTFAASGALGLGFSLARGHDREFAGNGVFAGLD